MKRRPRTVSFYVGRLPHWEVEGGRYFITIHLAGAIPQAGRNQIRATSKQLRQVVQRASPEWMRLQRRIFAQMEQWLDSGSVNTWLRQTNIATMVIEAIEHRQARGDWNLFEYVIMPTHIHLFGEIGANGLQRTLEDFKRWTGHQAMKWIDQGTSPDRFWQREWFDHWSRSDEEDDRIAAYIRNNPVKAKLVAETTDWPFGSWSTSRLPDGT